MVVSEIAGQDATEVALAEDEHVIQALAPDRADEPLHERVLPRALRRDEDFGWVGDLRSNGARVGSSTRGSDAVATAGQCQG
jgi:hypothetical protein